MTTIHDTRPEGGTAGTVEVTPPMPEAVREGLASVVTQRASMRSPPCASVTTHGWRVMAPKHRMAASPGLRIGVPASTPKTPTLVIVIVPPDMSAGWVRPSRAVVVRAAMASASSRIDIRSASLMLGTMRPRGVAAAMPRLT